MELFSFNTIHIIVSKSLENTQLWWKTLQLTARKRFHQTKRKLLPRRRHTYVLSESRTLCTSPSSYSKKGWLVFGVCCFLVSLFFSSSKGSTWHRSESRRVLNFPPVTIFPYPNLPLIFEVLIVDRAWLGRGSRYKLRENSSLYLMQSLEKSLTFLQSQFSLSKPSSNFWGTGRG